MTLITRLAGSYPSAEVQSVYSTAPAHWARKIWNKSMLKKKELMKLIDKKFRLILRTTKNYKSLNSLKQDFTNLNEYFLSKWFQISWMAVKRSSLIDEDFLYWYCNHEVLIKIFVSCVWQQTASVGEAPLLQIWGARNTSTLIFFCLTPYIFSYKQIGFNSDEEQLKTI